MTLSDRIRRAALGPTPKPERTIGGPWMLSHWIGVADTAQVVQWLRQGGPTDAPVMNPFAFTNNTIRRFFLLFVAEAIEEAESPWINARAALGFTSRGDSHD